MAVVRVPVLTWNLAIGLQSERHARRQMRAVASMEPLPRILVLVEARQQLYGAYASELEARTGLAWNGVAQGHCARDSWNGDASSCARLDDEAVIILASLPIVSAHTTLLPRADAWHAARAAVHAEVDVDGAALHVFGTHLQAGVGSGVTNGRLDSIVLLRDWMAGFGFPAIVGGDFNELPASAAIAQPGVGMAPAFVDSSTACGVDPSPTYPAWWPTLKIDYWFVDTRGKVKAASTSVARCVWLSDHYPLRATFEIDQSESPTVRESESLRH